MKRIILFALISVLSCYCHAQSPSQLKLEAYFTAIIVDDIETSIAWYTSILGFEIKSRYSSDERGFKQSNLERKGILLELLELNSAVKPEDAIPNYTSRTRLNGLFKAGFMVDNFEMWIDHFEKSKVEFHGKIVINPTSGKKMVILLDPDKNKIQIFEK